MGYRIKKRSLARFKKRVFASRGWLLVGGVVILVGVMTYNGSSDVRLNAAAYKPLLNTIAKGESGGNYNAYFGEPANDSIRFTEMTLGDVLRWQADFVRQGNVSSAVGKYQIIRPTLVDITDKLHIDHSVKFDESLQDRIAIALIERRGSLAYVNSEMTRDEFATNLAKEWAALPNVSAAKPHESYYAGDGINRAQVTADEIYDALDSLQESAEKNE